MTPVDEIKGVIARLILSNKSVSRVECIEMLEELSTDCDEWAQRIREEHEQEEAERIRGGKT